MQALIIATILSFGMLGSVAYLAMGDQSWSKGHSERMRGRDAYYDGERSYEEPVAVVNTRIISDSAHEACFLVLDFDFSYRIGREIDRSDAQDLIEKRRVRLRDALLVHLSEFPASEMDSLRGKFHLKRVLRDIVQETVFPEELARIDDVLFRRVLLQRTRHD